MKMDLGDPGCEGGKWVELAQGRGSAARELVG